MKTLIAALVVLAIGCGREVDIDVDATGIGPSETDALAVVPGVTQVCAFSFRYGTGPDRGNTDWTFTRAVTPNGDGTSKVECEITNSGGLVLDSSVASAATSDCQVLMGAVSLAGPVRWWASGQWAIYTFTDSNLSSVASFQCH